ncbi:ATP-binding protein [Nocardiopsis sediminis]|uniref:ATP-binding protein n=1 Tax=Nocardiopsis sediminis TaxID=1778267 RepID=A0ABV8FMT2_9ACTN
MSASGAMFDLVPHGEDSWPGRARFIRGDDDAVAVARLRVARALGSNHPCRGQASVVAEELVANAVQHSRSGERGNELVLHITCTVTNVRIEVTDAGPLLARPTVPTVSKTGGLARVAAVSRSWDFEQHPNRFVTVWAELEARR